MPTDFNAIRDRAAKEGQIVTGGSYFKLKDGDNRIRVLSAPLGHPGEYNGKPNFKWLLYVLDRTDGQVKPMFMSPVIFDQLGDIQRDPDFEFDDVPVPFDINIKTTGAGTIKARYSVIPSPKRSPITVAEQNLLDAAKPLAELQKIIYEKTGKPTHEDEEHFDPDEIPA